MIESPSPLGINLSGGIGLGYAIVVVLAIQLVALLGTAFFQIRGVLSIIVVIEIIVKLFQ